MMDALVIERNITGVDGASWYSGYGICLRRQGTQILLPMKSKFFYLGKELNHCRRQIVNKNLFYESCTWSFCSNIDSKS